jgi:hypothetical protein
MLKIMNKNKQQIKCLTGKDVRKKYIINTNKLGLSCAKLSSSWVS